MSTVGKKSVGTVAFAITILIVAAGTAAVAVEAGLGQMGEDFDNYPRTLERDTDLLEGEGTDLNAPLELAASVLKRKATFLDDGTMVVVEGGGDHIELELDVTVTRILQTVAGRMIFAEMAPSEA